VHCLIPVSRGGTNLPDNCVPAHYRCNMKQGNLMPWDGPFVEQQWIDEDP
jgi:hypothetical protein